MVKFILNPDDAYDYRMELNQDDDVVLVAIEKVGVFDRWNSYLYRHNGFVIGIFPHIRECGDLVYIIKIARVGTKSCFEIERCF